MSVDSLLNWRFSIIKLIVMSPLSSWQPGSGSSVWHNCPSSVPATHAWSSLTIGDFHNPSKCWITIPGQCAQFTRSDPHAKSPADADKCPTKRQKDEKCSKTEQKRKRSLQPSMKRRLLLGNWPNAMEGRRRLKSQPPESLSWAHFKSHPAHPLQPISTGM